MRRTLRGRNSSARCSLACVWLAVLACIAVAGERSELEWVARRSDSQVVIHRAEHLCRLDITSPFGIDQARVLRRSGTWPRELVLRLYLRGLESLRITSGDETVEWSAGADAPGASRVTRIVGRDEIPLDAASPFYAQVVSGSQRGPPAEPVPFFELKVPDKLLESNPPEILVRWIDFYRN